MFHYHILTHISFYFADICLVTCSHPLSDFPVPPPWSFSCVSMSHVIYEIMHFMWQKKKLFLFLCLSYCTYIMIYCLIFLIIDMFSFFRWKKSIHIYYSFICSSTDRHWSCFHILILVNSIATILYVGNISLLL